MSSNNSSVEEKLFIGNSFFDDRGYLSFFNDFNEWNKIVRFYQVENRKVDSIRAFHGHKRETKYVYVAKGAILLHIATTKGVQKSYILDASKPQILKLIPDGVNPIFHGFKILEPGTIIQFFSDKSLEESQNDDFRLSWDCFGSKLWEDNFR